jgi:hypothetical protein
MSDDSRDVAGGRRAEDVTGGRVGGLLRLLPGAVRELVVLVVGLLVVPAVDRRDVVDVPPIGRLGAPAAEPASGRFGGTFSGFFEADDVFVGCGVLVSRSSGIEGASAAGASVAAVSETAGRASGSAMMRN